MAGRLSRLARLGSLTGKVVAGRVQDTLRGSRVAERARQVRHAREVARTLGQLKGAAMKVGQQLAIAASQLDDLPDEVKASLASLHADGEPVPFETIRETVEAELGGALADLFARFDEAPLGTASLAQAHAAALPDGTEVVVKVLHDGAVEGLEADLLALRGVLAGGRLLGRDAAELADIFDEVETRLREELDYLQEAANIEAFVRRYGDDPRVNIPRTHPAWCTERVLTMDRVPGVPVDTFVAEASDEVRQRAGMILAELFFEQAFHHRVLHADPHPGNYLFEPDGTVGLLDFGCVKRFDEFFLGTYARSVLAALDGDEQATLQACRDLGTWTGDDPGAGEAIWAFCDAVVSPWRGGPSTIGEGDDLLARVKPTTTRLWQYSEIRGARDMLLLHRTLGGLYAMARQLRVHGDWGAMLRTHLGHAIAVAEGRAA